MRLNKRLAILLVAITLALFPFNLVSAQEDISLPATVSAFNQEYQGPNGYWGNCGLGTNGCPDKISTTGCLITAFAMVLDYYNVSLFIPRESSCTNTARTGMDPGILNDWLKTHGGYGRCGSDTGSCCLEWTNLPPQVSVTKHVNRSDRGLDSTAQRMIDQSLLQGYPVIGGVHWDSYCHGATTQTEDCHWVVITGKKDSIYTIIDPYNSDTTDPSGVRTTLDHGTFGAYTIDRFVVVKGIVPSSPLANLFLSLSFSPRGNIKAGVSQVRSLAMTGAEPGTPILLYARVIDPHGDVSYAYYRSQAETKLHYSREKRSFYPTPRAFSNGTILLNKESTASEDAGTWTWEVWAEDPQDPGTPHGYDIAAYTISSSGAQAQTGIAIALALAIFIASLIYVSILLR